MFSLENFKRFSNDNDIDRLFMKKNRFDEFHSIWIEIHSHYSPDIFLSFFFFRSSKECRHDEKRNFLFSRLDHLIYVYVQFQSLMIFQ